MTGFSRAGVTPLPPAPELPVEDANRYLHELGVAARARQVVPCAGGLSNHNYRIDLDDGTRALLRIYRWWIPEPEPPRGRKERWLHDLLARAGVPVPAVIAASERCALLEWIDGEKLRETALRESADGLLPAWRQTGDALRRTHEMRPLGDRPGEIVGLELKPFEPNWPRWLAAELARHATRLRELRVIDGATFGRVVSIAQQLPDLLDLDEAVLLHNDAHPANVLVHRSEAGWELAAWIDWEFAWVGDPDWDLTRFEFIGTAQVGEIPAAFWEGYGRRPDRARARIYELFFTTWLAGIRSEKRPVTAPELFARERVSQLDQLLSEIERA